MKLEKQVCSLELAKRLKELGVKQDSEYEWETDRRPSKQKPVLKTSSIRGCRRCGAIINGLPRPTIACERFAAFTVAELGQMLPARIKGRKYLNLVTTKREIPKEHFQIGYAEQDWEEVVPNTEDCAAQIEADARAKMLIYLLENDLMDKSSVQPPSAR